MHILNTLQGTLCPDLSHLPIAIQPSFTIHSIKTDAFLIVLFDCQSPTATDSLTAINQGIAATFPTYSTLAIDRVMREDYLWQDNCFECFISTQPTANNPYLEINLATNGAFNVYHFDHYRTPNTMPPRQLAKDALNYGTALNFFNHTIGCERVFWHSASEVMLNTIRHIEDKYVKPAMANRLGMVFEIAALNRIFKTHSTQFYFHPCRVLDETHFYQTSLTTSQCDQDAPPRLSYWALRHVTPADFHDKSMWHRI